MENQIAGSQPALRRQPLKPMNTPANLTTNFLPKTSTAVKENDEISDTLPSPTIPSIDFLLPKNVLSLAEELSAARRRNERLRLEKEKTEILLRQRDLVLENGVREAERRGLAQREVELQLQHLLSLIHHRSLPRVEIIGSLRKQEEERIRGKASMVCSSRCDEEDEAGSTVVDEKGDSSPIFVPL